MTQPASSEAAIRVATEATTPKELTKLYHEWNEDVRVVNAVVQNAACPDEIKKQVVSYMLQDRLPRSLQPSSSNPDILAAIRKCIEAWQPVQRTAQIPDVDPNDVELQHLVDLVQRKAAVIFHGPPGTSKTYLARILAKALTDGEESRQEFVQFHPSYSYEDFIEGIVPRAAGNGITYRIQNKVFKSFCRRAEQQSSKRFVFIIDELNRADVSKVFGEVFTSLEYRGESVRLLYSRRPFTVPSNVVILGTMNTIDRSTMSIDFALRRRFYFVYVGPDEKKLDSVLNDNGRSSVDPVFKLAVVDAFKQIQRIYPLGHAYFKGISSAETLSDLWHHQLHPLLEEYFEFEQSKVADIRRILAAVWSSPRIGATSGPPLVQTTDATAPGDQP